MLLIKSSENDIYVENYKKVDVLLRIITFFWIGSIITKYIERSKLDKLLTEPVNWFQKVFIAEFPSPTYFYSIAFLGLILCIYTIFYKNIITRFLLFLLLLWLNAYQWGNGVLSHSSYLLFLAHFFSMFLIIKKDIDIHAFAKQIRYFQIGILMTYSLAGFWKFFNLFKNIISPNPDQSQWYEALSVRTNAITNLLVKSENHIPEWKIIIYDIPYFWQISTYTIFFFQLIAIFAALRLKWSYIIIPAIISFHVYNTIFIETFFYPAIFTLIVVFFPYQLFSKKQNA